MSSATYYVCGDEIIRLLTVVSRLSNQVLTETNNTHTVFYIMGVDQIYWNNGVHPRPNY